MNCYRIPRLPECLKPKSEASEWWTLGHGDFAGWAGILALVLFGLFAWIVSEPGDLGWVWILTPFVLIAIVAMRTGLSIGPDGVTISRFIRRVRAPWPTIQWFGVRNKWGCPRAYVANDTGIDHCGVFGPAVDIVPSLNCAFGLPRSKGAAKKAF